jgi:hypothetical protein
MTTCRKPPRGITRTALFPNFDPGSGYARALAALAVGAHEDVGPD